MLSRLGSPPTYPPARGRLGASGLCLVLLAGCSSLYDPHITLNDTPSGAVSFEAAEIYANDAKDKYREALGEYSRFNKLLGASLIPLGAATLGLGITGASSTAVTALGLTGATGFGLGSWLQSTPTQQAYIGGHNATNCAIEAMLPLKVVSISTNPTPPADDSNQPGSEIPATLDAAQLQKFRQSLGEIDSSIVHCQR